MCDRREAIYEDDQDRRVFLTALLRPRSPEKEITGFIGVREYDFIRQSSSELNGDYKILFPHF